MAYGQLDVTTTVFGKIDLGLILYSSGNKWIHPYGDGLSVSSGTHTLRWDGRDTDTNAVYTGSFGIQVDFTPYTPNTVLIQGNDNKLVIAGQGTNIDVTTDPYLVYLSYGQFTKINYHLTTTNDQDVDVIIKLLPPGINSFDDPLAIEILNEQQSTNDYEVTWTGINDTDPNQTERTIDAEGAYSFAIKATGQSIKCYVTGVIECLSIERLFMYQLLD